METSISIPSLYLPQIYAQKYNKKIPGVQLQQYGKCESVLQPKPRRNSLCGIEYRLTETVFEGGVSEFVESLHFTLEDEERTIGHKYIHQVASASAQLVYALSYFEKQYQSKPREEPNEIPTYEFNVRNTKVNEFSNAEYIVGEYLNHFRHLQATHIEAIPVKIRKKRSAAKSLLQ